MTQRKPEKIYLIVNNYSGYQHGEKALEIVVPLLQKSGCQVNYAFTQYAGHATVLAAEASQAGYDLVVAVGGDGTVNETAQGLMGTPTLMGIVPIGSGNGLARELGISISLEKSAKTLLTGADRQIDVCRMNKQRFFCASGIGIDALIAYQMSKASSRGFWRYIQLAIRESILYKPVNVRMKIDHKPVNGPVFLVAFANASQFGNNAFIAPAATMTDGLMDVIVVKPFYKIWLPLFAVALFTKKIHLLPFVDAYKARKVELEWTDSKVFHFDGEPGTLAVPATISIDSASLFVRC